ncbi:D-beta-hydroxybutyrate dehydrogenase, mitochondrial-like [Acanthaster planci]|uniref:D-beta-hydroxybutyrate dehydrogenase, mitochondrial-like n=1 Tax=Acanthaster planci TaxID=133434 RepID=A0A8B7Z525_ACAPL|nr:D-beta-hydroxybutyrate dehydrogenase, mitochondrial-like [Acanthaster planci]
MFPLIAAILVACISGFWLGTRLVSHLKGRVDPRGKSVLVTGCDTGFGHSLAGRLHSLGFMVFAGCLDSRGEGAAKLTEEARRVEGCKKARCKRMKVLQMDICKDDEVNEAVKIVTSLLRKDEGLWAIVNNAGLSTFGEVEWCSLAVFKRMAEVNVWGGIRAIKAFLPLIRKAKGRIVQMTSGLGRQALAGRSCYVLTKYAMEGFSQCLRYEMRRWGVRVSIIEPGNFIAATGIFTQERIHQIASQMWEDASEETRQAYGKETFDTQVERMNYYSQIGTTDPSPVIDAMVAAITDRHPRIRYEPKDWYWRLRTFIMTILPQRIGDWLYHS